MEFGFYPKHFRCQIGGITVSTLDDLDGKVRGVMQDGGIDKDWCYAPPARNRAGGRTDVLPFASRVFGLPKTHALHHASPQSDDQLRFLIQCFGFFVGMRMTDTEAGFLDATPVKPGKTSDMVWLGDSHINALAHADQFWFAHTEHPRICAAMRGIIHNYFLSATPTLLDFERFIYLYVALEGCHYIRACVGGQSPRSGSHGQRIATLCGTYDMPVPSWADPAQAGVATFRHEALHEGLFFDEPFGFQIYGGNTPRFPEHDGVLREMSHLICRLVLALLGMNKNPYVTSPINSRQMIGIRI